MAFNVIQMTGRDVSGPAIDLFAVTPSDSADVLPGQTLRGFWLSADGTLRVTTARGNVRDFASGFFPTKTIIDLAVTRVHASGTSATVYGVV